MRLTLGGLLLAAALLGQASESGQVLPKFLGRPVTLAIPKLDEDGFFPEGPSTVCVEGPPQRQCFTAPEKFGRNPSVSVVEVTKNLSALHFSADGGGVSGIPVFHALLRLGQGKDLDNLFRSGLSLSEQSQHVFWKVPSISDAQIFVTAEYVWGSNESHYGLHRYIISTYVLKHSSEFDLDSYHMQDQFMTVRSYDVAEQDILTAEKGEITARLKRVKAAQAIKASK
jgi:hypothetical protein